MPSMSGSKVCPSLSFKAQLAMTSPASSDEGLVFLKAGEPFPPLLERGAGDRRHPGLLAVGGDLSVDRLYTAYSRGMFPWFGPNEPILWWCTEPRMVLQTAHFRLYRSLKQSLMRNLAQPDFHVSTNRAFDQVIAACSEPRGGQAGTWIIEDMQRAYLALHRAGHAHSFEVWRGAALVGGLYGVNIGRMFYGESMFTRETDASKIALFSLVNACRTRGIDWIDCQQVTAHLASLGAAPVAKATFLAHLSAACSQSAPEHWAYDKNQLLKDTASYLVTRTAHVAT
jgi:leucyl/phenylalanyl-tRNA---protein transferase